MKRDVELNYYLVKLYVKWFFLKYQGILFPNEISRKYMKYIYVIEEYYLFCTSQAIHDMDYNLHY